MINITKARELTSQSEAAIAAVVEKIGVLIEKAAKAGKRCVLLDEELNDESFKTVRNNYSPPPTGSTRYIAIQTAVMKHGFRILPETRTHHVGGGLGSYEETREEIWGHYAINW
jgi:hypothetical protein